MDPAADDAYLQRDLQVAATIQKSCLPGEIPSVPGAEVAALMIPARLVGGDFYDLIPLASGRLGMVVADVSGKGVPAALFMALSRTLLRAHSLSAQPRYLTDALESAGVRKLMRSGSLGALAALGAVRETNDYLLAHHWELCMFVTTFYGVYEPHSRLLTYVNAGHNPPLIQHPDGTQDWLAPTDVAIGLMPGRPFESQECRLRAGDALVMYTDGVTEAQNEQHRLYGDERLAAAVGALQGCPAQAILDGIVSSVSEFVAGAPQADDLTLTVLVIHS